MTGGQEEAKAPLSVTLRESLNSLKARMAFVVAIVLIPPVFYSAFQAVAAFGDRATVQTATINRTVDLITSYENDFFAGTRRLLNELSRNDALGDPSLPQCSAVLADELRKYNDYRNFAVIDRSGNSICGSSAAIMNLNFADRSWVREVLNGKDFVVSEVLQSRTGQGPTIVASVPMMGADGSISHVIGASIELTKFNAITTSLPLPLDSVAYLVDRTGALVIGNPATQQAYVRSAPSPQEISGLIEDGKRDIEATGVDGIERRYVVAGVAGDRLYVLIGVPLPSGFGWLERDLVIGLFSPTLILGLAITAIWLATDFLVLRHIRSLAKTARAYSRGALDVRPKLKGSPTELRELGQTFARMADRVQHRERELQDSLAQKDILLREIHHRVKNNLQIVTSLLNLRTQALRSPQARSAMIEAQTRIKTLALVHRNLYEHDDVRTVELRSFIGELCDLLRAGVESTARDVELVVSATPTILPTDRAIPLALLITESVSNAFKHAFPNGGSGRIEVRLSSAAGTATLVVADDGIGMEEASLNGGDIEEPGPGIGVTLIEMLAKQLKGSLLFEGPPGTRMTLTFPV